MLLQKFSARQSEVQTQNTFIAGSKPIIQKLQSNKSNRTMPFGNAVH